MIRVILECLNGSKGQVLKTNHKALSGDDVRPIIGIRVGGAFTNTDASHDVADGSLFKETRQGIFPKVFFHKFKK